MNVAERPLLVGSSPLIVDLRQEIERVARSDAKVLCTGERGVGKEVVARAIHGASPRQGQEFVAVNCAGLPETLLESELFGRVNPSVTSASRDKPGKLEMAHEGTLFLDEVGDMTLRMQGLLLRFLETGELQTVGSDHSGGTVNVRLIAATNRNLRPLIDQGRFREDLFYRLNVVTLKIPPLRERRKDIPELIAHFMQRYTTNGNRSEGRRIDPEAVQILTEYAWPGNVRELENAIERLVGTVASESITVKDLPAELQVQSHVAVRPKHERRRTVADDLYKKLVEEHESFWNIVYPLYMRREITRGNVRDLVRKGLEDTRGNYTLVTRLFNIEPREYKRFLNFLRKHDCQVPFKEYR
jgi:transcriptional regulator with PAS, ATPase and Fis domain